MGKQMMGQIFPVFQLTIHGVCNEPWHILTKVFDILLLPEIQSDLYINLLIKRATYKYVMILGCVNAHPT